MTEAKLLANAPILLVKDVAASAEYFREKVGFKEQNLYGSPTNFAIIRRDGCTLMLAQVATGHVIVPNWRIIDKMWDVYFWVDEIDALYAEYQQSGAIIDYSLYTTPRGMKEFGIQDLDDHDIGFGQRRP